MICHDGNYNPINHQGIGQVKDKGVGQDLSTFLQQTNAFSEAKQQQMQPRTTMKARTQDSKNCLKGNYHICVSKVNTAA
jgi:hypothetical protein